LIIGEGSFKSGDDRQAALNFAFGVAGVHAVTIGYIDGAIDRVNQALNV